MEGVPRQNAWRGGRGLTMNCPSLPARHAIRQARIGVHNGIRLWRPSLARAPWPVAWRSAAPPRSRRRNHLSAEDRILISPARCTFLLRCLPAIDVLPPEACPLACRRRSVLRQAHDAQQTRRARQALDRAAHFEQQVAKRDVVRSPSRLLHERQSVHGIRPTTHARPNRKVQAGTVTSCPPPVQVKWEAKKSAPMPPMIGAAAAQVEVTTLLAAK